MKLEKFQKDDGPYAFLPSGDMNILLSSPPVEGICKKQWNNEMTT
jgi:hypothetical protein